MRDQVLWRKTARIATILAERLDIDAERALNILYNSRTYALLDNPDSGLQLMSDDERQLHIERPVAGTGGIALHNHPHREFLSAETAAAQPRRNPFCGSEPRGAADDMNR